MTGLNRCLTAGFALMASLAFSKAALVSADIDPTRGQLLGETEDLGGGDYVLHGGGYKVVDGGGDSFHFAYETISGDFDKRVRIESIDGTSVWSRGGLQVRETLNPTSRVVKIVAANPNTSLTPAGANQVATFSRSSEDFGYGDCGRRYSGVAAVLPNQWLRLTRTGNNFQMFVGTDGENWSMVAQHYVPNFASAALVGLYAGADSADGTVQANVAFASYSDTPITDELPPTLVSAGTLDRRLVGIKFSEQVSAATAAVAGNYHLSQGTVLAAEVGASGNSVYLTVSGLTASSFTVTVNGVTDRANNRIADGSTVQGKVVDLIATDVGEFVDFGDRPQPGDDPYVISRSVAVGSGDQSEIEVVGGGSNIWSGGDDMTYIYKERTGDFDVQVEVARLDRAVGSASFGHAGIMIRDGLYRPGDVPGVDPPKPFIYTANGTRVRTVMNTTYAEGNQERTAIVIWRASDGGGYGNSGVIGSGTKDAEGIIGRWGNLRAGNASGAILADTAPTTSRWLRVRRRGDDFISYWSYDGINWTEYNVRNQPMPATLLVGFASMTDTPGKSATIGVNRAAHYATATIRNFGDFPTGLRIRTLPGGNVEVRWSAADGTLQTSTSPDGPWDDLVGATSPYVEAVSGTPNYYRLKRP